ncbi:MAG: VOC family protein [Acidimicrobiales bacterium]
MSDPFEILNGHDTSIGPDAEFAAQLRHRIALMLSAPTLRSSAMPTTRVTPYLTVHNGPAALDFYASALGAVEVMRVVMDEATGQLGHAEFHIAGAVFYLSDEFAEMGVLSPRTLGGTSVALHVEVDDVDSAFATAVAAGAEALAEPADQPHGARHGTLVDPFGHRWLLSQQIEQVSPDQYGDRMSDQGAMVTSTPAALPDRGGIWAALNFADARKGIEFMVEVLGFDEDLIVPGEDPNVIEHSQLRWPEGGVVQAATANRVGNPFSERPIGTESLYVITADPVAVYDRCVAADVEVLMSPEPPAYDPEGLVFTIRDPEGNLWSFGSYSGVE